MLPTEEKSTIFIQTRDVFGKGTKRLLEYSNNETYLNNIHLVNSGRANTNDQSKYSFYHLYFLLIEDIYPGDYWVYLNPPEFDLPKDSEIRENNLPHSWFENLWDKENYYKVIASTKTSLDLSQPSEGFINKYIEKCNKGEEIKEVDVEYDLFWNNKRFKHQPFPDEFATEKDRVYDLKVNSKDNTITIKSIKNSWTRKECIILIKQFGRDFGLYVDTVQYKEINQWLTKNL